MELIIAAIFGVVQGLTEFIPVSSSGHLLLLHQLLPAIVSDDLSFDVALHVGTLLALLVFFWHDVWRLVAALISRTPSPERRLARLIILGIIPAGIAGLLFDSFIETALRSPYIVVLMLAVVGVLFIVVEKVLAASATASLDQLTWRQAVAIGLAQMLALIPGTSRSGITIIAGIMTGIRRADAARYSFLLSIPLVAAAGLKKGADLVTIGIPADQWPLIISGLVVSAVVGYGAIRFLLQYLQHHSLAVFGWYRIVLAAIVTVVLLIS